jgi:antitoxin CptB
MNADAARLRWRCRRGMRELDQLLEQWLNVRFTQADASMQRAFAELLEEQDPQLWDWLSGRAAPPRSDWQCIVDEIRNRGRL